MKWMPIESAPISTEIILLDNDGCVRVGEVWHVYTDWNNDVKYRSFRTRVDFGNTEMSHIWAKDHYATHWMPLPEPPNE